MSRRYGGIHPSYDDYPSRIAGARIGQKAWSRATQFYEGTSTLPGNVPGPMTSSR